MICNLQHADNIIKKEKLEILVVSYGGCCSNTLINALEKNGYKCRTTITRTILGHCPLYVKCDIPVIYIYKNPILAFMSMKRRGNRIWGTNQRKLSNNMNVKLSNDTLLQLMFRQFYSWTSHKQKNILFIRSEEIFGDNIVNKLSQFLKREMKHFPIPYKEPSSSIEHIDKEYNHLFKKYKTEIDYINSFDTNA